MTRRRIKKASIHRIALVPRGANRMPVLYKSAEQEVDLCPLTKLDEERGELLAVVYAPEHRDSHGDIASAEVIREMAHEFVKNGAELDLRHGEEALRPEQAHLAESFIVQKNDERFIGWSDYDGKPVDLEGAWAVVLKIEDPELRQLYRDGKWNGVSMAGPGLVEIEKSTMEVDRFLEELSKKLAGTITESPEEIDMKPEELKDFLKEANADLAKSLADVIAGVLSKKAEEAVEEPKAEAPIDISKETDPAKLLAFAKQKRIDALRKEFDFEVATAEDIIEFQKALQDIEVEFDSMAQDLKKSAARPASRQRADATPAASDAAVSEDLSKDERDLAKAGFEIGKLANSLRGY